MFRRLIESRPFKSLPLSSAAIFFAIFLYGGCNSSNGNNDPATATPVKHLVVIYMENASFDLLFGTYPDALNPEGEPQFEPRPGTPAVNNLTGVLLTDNPNESNPFRIGRLESFTCDQDHDYTSEQMARNDGLMYKFVQFDAEPPTDPRQFCSQNAAGHWDTVMGCFDGNTVTAL